MRLLFGPQLTLLILVRREGIFARRQGTDGSRGQAIGIGIVPACLPAGDGPRDRLAVSLRVVGNDEEPAGLDRVAEAEALQRRGTLRTTSSNGLQISPPVSFLSYPLCWIVT